MERKHLVYFLFIFIAIVFTVRLFYIQVIDDSYKLSAENNSRRTITLYPDRGFIYDRNGQLLVANQPAYDIMVTPNNVKTLDTNEFCELANITKEEFILKMKKARKKPNSPRKPSIFIKEMSKGDYAIFKEKLYKYEGFFAQSRTLREYPIHSAANVLGYVNEVSQRTLEKEPYYQKGDNIGEAGIEKSYEEYLRGSRGVKRVMVDVHNNVVGSFQGGKYDTLATPGSDVTSTIDIVLQAYGERLMKNKRGSIVAIEPSTGEILALISSPTYDPNLLVGRIRSKNYTKLYNDSINKPLFDRGLLATYPPGSPFKLMNALIGLQEGTITENTTFTCRHGFHYGSLHVSCHCDTHHPIALKTSISKSCNNYYCNVYKGVIEKYHTTAEGFMVWHDHVTSFGLGKFLNNDLPTGTKGKIPDVDYYNAVYGGTSWRAVTTISNAIGQGEILTSPIQLANFTATIANRGYYYTPHIVKSIDGKPIDDENFTKPKYTTIDSVHFEKVIEGMYDVFENGTARGSRLEGIEMCGKTGTAENPHGQDHSIFIAFAPKDNPKIAIAIVVENGYWGSRWAAPITSLLIEQYITGEISREALEKRMLEGDLSDEYELQLEQLIKKAEEKRKRELQLATE